MGTPLRVLIVEDSEEDTLLIVRELKRGGFDPINKRVETHESMKTALTTKTWDLILADYSMPHFSGLEALKLFKESGLDLPFIIVSGSIGEDVAVEAMKAGAHDYLMKNNLTRLIPAIQQELRQMEVRRKLKHSEKALQEAEKRYRQVVENATEIIYAVDEKGNFTYGNPAGLKATGYSLQELREFNYADLVLPEHRKRVMKVYINQFRQRIPTTHVEFPFFNKAGKIIWFGQNSTLVMEGDKVVGFHIIARDITERKKAEQALSESEQRYRNLVENAPDVIYTLGPDGTITSLNPAFETITGWSRTEWLGKQFVSILHPDDLPLGMEFWQRILRGEMPPIFELRILSKSGDYVVGEFIATPQTQNGSVINVLGIARDITERKRAEERLSRINECFLSFGTDPSENINRLTALCGEVMEATCALYNRIDGDVLCSVGKWNTPPDYNPIDKPEGHICYDVIQRGGEDIYIVHDLPHTKYAKTDPNVTPYKLQTYIGKAVKWQGAYVGSLCVVYQKDFFPDEADLKTMGIIASAISIEEERKQSEVALRRSKREWENTFDAITDWISLLDLEARILRTNLVGEKFTVVPPAQMVGQVCCKLVHGSEKPLPGCPFQKMLHTHHRESKELKSTDEDRWSIVTVDPVMDEKGNLVGGVHIVRDITLRKQAEEQIEALAKFPSENPNPILRIGRDGTLLYTNEAGYMLLQDWKLEIGRPAPLFLRETASETLTQQVRKIIDIEHDQRTISFFVAPVVNASYANFYGRDVTERKRAEEELRSEREKLELVTQNMGAGLALISKDYHTLWANDILKQIFGDAEGKTCFSIYNQRAEICPRCGVREVFEKGSEKVVHEQVGKDIEGNTIWSEIVATPIKDKDGNIMAALELVIPITERKKAEEALRISEEKYRMILENIEDGYYEVDIAGNLTFFNDSFCRIYGYPREELMGMNDRQYTDEENAKKLFKAFNKVYRTGESTQEFDWEIIRKDEAKRYIEASASLIEDPSGNKVGFRGLVRDITERKSTEEALRVTQFSLEHAPEAVLWINSKGQLGYVNEETCRSLGYARHELLSMALWDIDPNFSPGKWATHWQNLPSRGPATRESHHRAKDGKIFPIEVTGDYLKYGAKEYNVAFVRDITERKLAERKMAEVQEQLRQSQKMEAIGQLAGGVAHDFNNLLTVIKGYSQLYLVEVRKDDPLRENIEEIRKAADRAADLTRQLLAFSRRQVMEMRVLDLNELLTNLDKMLRRMIGEDIDLVTLLERNLGRVKTDPGQMEQVIMNLAVNARDAMPNGGKLTIETANVELDQAYARAHIAVTPGRYVMISVSDTGVGMTPEIRDRVFEPFFTTKEKEKGTGLGLSTVYGIVKQSGGNIWVYSEPGKGTTLKIYLPCVDEPSEGLKERVVSKELPRGSEIILIVEDEEVVLKLAGRILRRQGYEVREVLSGEEALKMCKEQRKSFHLLLTDVVMPQMSGRQLADQLKGMGQDFKVLYMSGYTDNAITHHGMLDKGANYLQKPFTVESLARKVREVLDK